jgi:hypothetical protein
VRVAHYGVKVAWVVEASSVGTIEGATSMMMVRVEAGGERVSNKKRSRPKPGPPC